MRLSSELMQFEMGMSTRRYLPARGTAGFGAFLGQGKEPRARARPPMMIDSTPLVAGAISHYLESVA